MPGGAAPPFDELTVLTQISRRRTSVRACVLGSLLLFTLQTAGYLSLQDFYALFLFANFPCPVTRSSSLELQERPLIGVLSCEEGGAEKSIPW